MSQTRQGKLGTVVGIASAVEVRNCGRRLRPCSNSLETFFSSDTAVKEIEIIHRLFLVITIYCQASSSQFNESLNPPHCQLAGKEAQQVHAVGRNSLETTYLPIYYLNFLTSCKRSRARTSHWSHRTYGSRSLYRAATFFFPTLNTSQHSTARWDINIITSQRCRQVFKSGWVSSNVVGIICPPMVG